MRIYTYLGQMWEQKMNETKEGKEGKEQRRNKKMKEKNKAKKGGNEFCGWEKGQEKKDKRIKKISQ